MTDKRSEREKYPTSAPIRMKASCVAMVKDSGTGKAHKKIEPTGESGEVQF